MLAELVGVSQAYNYVQSVIPARYDLWLHIDRTRALHALHIQVSGQYSTTALM